MTAGTPAPRKRPSGEVRLDDTERALIATWRAFVAWGRERTKLDPTRDDPPDDDAIDLRVFSDGSGFVHVDPEDPNAPEFDAVTFYDLASAAGKIDASRKLAEVSRIERETYAGRRFGDPRKGRKRPKVAT